MIAAACRLVAAGPGRTAALATASLVAAVLALAPCELASAAARAAVVALVLAALALLVRRRERGAAAAPLVVVAREPLAGAAGVALVEAGGRRLLLGFGRDGVRLVAELGAAPPRETPPTRDSGVVAGRRP